ncbi:MAG: aminotransferase class V-fold PLP-dependent enzyme [Flammeovirgaceae bacterium]|nr:MAG: aminotransferase class V-fold PLP-dependent enzyme [Flammeovirgaceae bacterium]
MKQKIIFTPGPSQLYFTVEDHIRKAFRDGIPSLSHRSKTFEEIFIRATAGLRSLLGIPEHFHIVFTASATEIWERCIQNLVAEQSAHYVNGAFGKRFFETAGQLGKKAEAITASDDEGFTTQQTHDSAELIALTHNETSTGVSLPMAFINGFRETNPQALIAVDAVSSLPYPEFDFTKIDSLFFSVQKGFGLPAGLGVWIVNTRCLERAEQIKSKGALIGTYHNLPSLVSYARKNQTPETPNVLGIYLLAMVVEDMLRRGIKAIRNETEYKAAILYQALEANRFIKPFVRKTEWRSKTVVVADCGTYTKSLTEYLMQKGIQPGEGYGSYHAMQLRFANFPAHSKEQVELLVDLLQNFEP